MKKKSMFSVMCKTVMVLLTMLSLSFSNQISVKAWDSSIPHEFTRVKIFAIRNGGQEKYQA